MTDNQTGGPAFPTNAQATLKPDGTLFVPAEYGYGPQDGMSLRDWFAGQALAGLLPKLPLVDQLVEHGIKVTDKIQHNLEIAHSCYCLADAMLAERSK